MAWQVRKVKDIWLGTVLQFLVVNPVISWFLLYISLDALHIHINQNMSPLHNGSWLWDRSSSIPGCFFLGGGEGATEGLYNIPEFQSNGGEGET